MSTKFTTPTVSIGPPTPLTVLLEAVSKSVLQRLHVRLRECGYDTVTEPHLVLFGNLDCGATHAAQIAQRMQVSRQAISKTLRELHSLGFVRLEDDQARRNQKLVAMTEQGMQLASDARAQLHAIEAEIATEIGTEALSALRCALEAYWTAGPGQRHG